MSRHETGANVRYPDPMAMKTVEGLIECDPGRRGGAPRIAGTGIGVATIAGLRDEGLPPEAIASEVFEGAISVAQVLAALAYFELNRDEVLRFVREEGEAYDASAGDHAHGIE